MMKDAGKSSDLSLDSLMVCWLKNRKCKNSCGIIVWE